MTPIFTTATSFLKPDCFLVNCVINISPMDMFGNEIHYSY